MPIFDGKTTNPDEIHSDTNFIRMNAIRDEPDPNNIGKTYILTINLADHYFEFLAAENYKGYKVTLEEALEAINCFESMLSAENKQYATDKFSRFMEKF